MSQNMCIRCGRAPTMVNRTRCEACQTVVDEQTAQGLTSPAIAAALDAAHHREPEADL